MRNDEMYRLSIEIDRADVAGKQLRMRFRWGEGCPVADLETLIERVTGEHTVALNARNRWMIVNLDSVDQMSAVLTSLKEGKELDVPRGTHMESRRTATFTCDPPQPVAVSEARRFLREHSRTV